ncbi:hypothetical protein ACFWBF_35365 [Streptomyces sp. NPDC060028]|uniref:hypothetical protein n=1 Tax=Streptomyces sp. NPDC060028 TaxID=3347041 RepID=UPI00369F8734
MPLLVLAGLLLGPAATAAASVPAARQAPVAATAFMPGSLPAVGAGSVTGVHAPVSSPVRATTGDKKGKKSKKSKKSSGFFKKLVIVAVIVIVLLVVVYGVRRAFRRRSA